MSEAKKILFISQEITPYLPESDMANICRYMPQRVQESGREMRAFMPRFGCINERRNQLHEVIRLSGMNLIIDDTDHPLIIKVASIQAARMQVYFIDNEDYFQRKFTTKDANGEDFEDNDERSIFFTRGVIETVKKLRWTPDIVHCHGWMTSLIPLYIKKAFNDDPFFKDSKVVFSVYNNPFTKPFRTEFKEHLKINEIIDEDLASINSDSIDYEAITKLALDYSDGVIFTNESVPQSIIDYANSKSIQTLSCFDTENYAESYLSFYDSVMK